MERSSKPPSLKHSELRLRALLEITKGLSTPLDLKDTMELVVREVLRVLGMERGVLLMERGAGALETVVACHADRQTLSRSDLHASKEMLDALRRSHKPVVTFVGDAGSAEGDSTFWRLGSMVGLPLMDRHRFLGALILDSERKRANLEGENLIFMEAVAATASLALTNARSRARMVEAARVSEDFGTLLDLHDMFDRALQRIVEFTRAEQGFLIVRNEESGHMELWDGLDRQGKRIDEPSNQFLSRRVVRDVIRSGEAMLSDNVAEQDNYDDTLGSVVAMGLTSILCVPIRFRKQVLGVVFLQNRALEAAFDDEDKRLVQLVADRAGVAIENAKLYKQEREIVRALANAVEARDLGTSTHVQRVSEYAVAVGRRLGLAGEQLSDLEQSAMLHDVGKIGIPDRILLKTGPLSPEEWGLMQTHPQMGLGIVRPVSLPKDVTDGILYHQEAWDGSGYPHGVAGDDIPLFGRIIAVVDAYDAMTTDRPYRKAMTPAAAAAELDRCAGIKFDAEVVLAFMEHLREPNAGEK